LIGAIYLDSSIDICRNFVINQWKEFINNSKDIPDNPITELQEITQSLSKELPIYKVVRIEGSSHNPKFYCTVKFKDNLSEGHGESKKAAKQNAAKSFLEKIRL
jgi:ribonuclease III